MTDLLRRSWPLLLLFACVLLARVGWVGAYAEVVPYWDQWDAEAARLLKPWVEGDWRLVQLFDPHNEHRIAFTRLIVLALFEANGGHWDNLVAAFANAALFSGLLGVAWACLAPGLVGRGPRLALFVLLLALGALPFAWENLLLGFQSQFTLMALFALLALAAAAHQRDRYRALLPTLLLSGLGLFTMASGLVAPVAAGGVLLVRAWLGGLRPGVALAGNAVLATLAILAWLSVPVIAGHQPLKAQDAGEFVRALGNVLAWPLGGGLAGAAVIWLPTGLFLWRLLRSRRADAWQCVAGGLALWALLQAAAMAYSRGHGLEWPSSRYTEVLAMGVVANAWFGLRIWSDAARAPARGRRRLGPAVAALTLCVVAAGLAQSFPRDLAHAKVHSRLGQIQTANLRSYLHEGVPALLEVPFQHIPYPSAGGLARTLDDPSVRAMLPWTLRRPLGGQGSVLAGDFQQFAGDDGAPDAVLSCREGDCAAGQGSYQGPALETEAGWRFQPAWTGGGREALAIDGGPARERFARVRAGSFRPQAVDASRDGWLALSAPVEAGPLSVAAARLQAGVRAWMPPALGRSGSELIAILPVASGPSEAQPLGPGDELMVDVPSPRTGLLLRAAINVATYRQAADGYLRMTVCSQGRCVRAEAALAGLEDNEELLLALEQPLWLARGQRMQIRVERGGGERPVALWLPVADAGVAPLELRGAEGTRRIEQRTVNMALGYLR